MFLLSGIVFFYQWKSFTIKSTIQNLRNFSEIYSPRVIKVYMENIANKKFFLKREIYYEKEKQNNLEDVIIVKTNGIINYEFQNSKITTNSEIIKFIGKNAINYEVSSEIIGKSFITIVPYIDKWNRHYYSTVFIYRVDVVYGMINRYIYYFIGLEIFFLIVAVIVGYLLSRLTTKRLEELEKAALVLEKGNFEKEISLEGNDEFTHIAKILEKLRGNLREYVDRLNITIDKLKESSKLKDEFLENVSHELKTPLTSIIGYIDYLETGKLGEISEQQKNAISKIKVNTAKLSELISTLLLIQDKYRNKIEKVSLYDILNEVCSAYKDIIIRKQLRVECNFNESDYIILADREKLFSIFQHVLENAIKFTDKGEIKVTVENIPVKKRVRITFKDTGIGIPEEKLDKIFEKFVQLDGSRKRRFGGVGIGLYTVKEFLDEISGTITISSKENQGSKVIIEIPYIKSTELKKIKISL